MKIEDITTEVRPRSAWESIDLGLRMVQVWSRPIMLSWLLFVIPVCFIIYGVLHNHPFWSLFVIWWLKPVFDRIPLYIVSHSVFGDIPSVSDMRKILPSLLRPHLIKLLLWYRLDPVRSFNLPVWQLEGLKGNVRVKRARVLQKGSYNTALSLTYFSLFIQLILWLGCYALLTMLLPTNISPQDVSIFDFKNESLIPGLILNLFYVISLSIIEPFYVAGGFALYLNRRTHLEAWDIELKFRSLAKRMNSNVVHSSKAVAVIGIVFFIGLSNFNLVTPVQAKAADANYSDMSNKQAKTILEKVLKTDEFNTKVKSKSWHLKEGLFDDLFKDKKEKDNKELLKYGFLSALISSILSNLLYFIFGAIVFIFLVYLAFKLIKYLPKSIFKIDSKKIKQKNTTTAFGMDINPETLPDDIGRCAWDLWQKEKFIAALSLLYRGSLSKLVNRDGIKLPVSATEGDCINIINNSHIKENRELVDYFVSLTRMWQSAAYAHRLPELTDVKNSCESWSLLFMSDSNKV